MVHGVILAGGIGKRVGADIPKQYIEICNVPIIIYTIKSMLKVEEIDKIYIAVSKDYMAYVTELLAKYLSREELKKCNIVNGGKERIDTLLNATNFIVSNNTIAPDDVVIFHDAVRPFVTPKILRDSIVYSRKYNATVAGIPASDTMLVSHCGDVVDAIPDRATIFHGQAPDSFRLQHFLKLVDLLTDEQKMNMTGTSQVCTFNNEPIHLIPGDGMNFKITTIEDLERAESIARNRKD